MQNARRFEGKVAIVTGGGAGIGRACTLRLASEGAAVGIATLDPDEATAILAEVEGLGAKAAIRVGDLADPDFVREVYSAFSQELGHADVIINNVGIGIEAAFDQSDDAIFDRVMAVNFMTAVRLTRLALPAMLEKSSGSIVNIASAQGLFGWPGFSAYSASKGAIMAWSRQLANEYGTRGIRSNSVVPGAVMTPMNEARIAKDGPELRQKSINLHIIPRYETPEEVAAAAAFLASDEASFITGTELIVDGGTTVKAHWYS